MKRIKTYTEINESTIMDKVLNYKISEIDVKGILGTMKENKLSMKNLNKIVLNLYNFSKYAGVEVEDIEEILELALTQGVDVNIIDDDGYSLLVNSLFISEEAIKIVLRRNPILYSSSSDGDIFEYVSDCGRNPRYKDMLTTALEEINPLNYQTFKRDKKAKKFNL